MKGSGSAASPTSSKRATSWPQFNVRFPQGRARSTAGSPTDSGSWTRESAREARGDAERPQALAETFDERNEAVMAAIQTAVTVAKRRGITASICGQAPSVYPEVTEKLVEWGITSVSVSPDMIDRTREIIANAEVKLGRAPKP